MQLLVLSCLVDSASFHGRELLTCSCFAWASCSEDKDPFRLLVLSLLLLQYRLLVTSVRGLLPLPVHVHLGDKVAGREGLRLNFLDWNHIQLSLT